MWRVSMITRTVVGMNYPHASILSTTVFLAPSAGALEMEMYVCLSVGRFDLTFQQHLVHVAALYSIVYSGLDQCRPIQSTLVKSSQIFSNLVKSRKIFSSLFQAAYSACGGSLQSSLVQTRLVKTNLVYSSQSQSNLDKYSLGYFCLYFWLN